MVTIQQAIEREVGSLRDRAFWVLIALSCLKTLTGPSNLILLVFCAAPKRAFDDNPHGRNAQSIITEWNLTESRAWISGFIQSAHFFGFMFGAILFGQLSDLYGRRYVAFKGYVIELLIIFSMGFTQNWKQFIVLRALLGVTIGKSVAETSLFQEFCGPKLWSFNGIVLGSVGYSVNVIIHIAVAYYFPDWRTLCFISSGWGTLSLIYYFVVPESPRWLFSKGRIKEAEDVIAIFAKWNGRTDYVVLLSEDLSDRDDSDEEDQEESEPANQGDINHSDVEDKEYPGRRVSVLELFRHPLLRTNTLIMGMQWFNASFVYYCITLGSGALSTNFYLANIISTISSLPGLPLLMVLMGKPWSGRRRTLAACNFLAAMSAFLAYIVPQDGKSSYKLVLLMLGKLGISAGYDLIYIYTPEMYPTLLRSASLGTMSTCARIGGIFAPYLANIMISSDVQSPFVLYGIICATCGVVGLFLPETLGKPIPNEIEDLRDWENFETKKWKNGNIETVNGCSLQ